MLSDCAWKSQPVSSELTTAHQAEINKPFCRYKYVILRCLCASGKRSAGWLEVQILARTKAFANTIDRYAQTPLHFAVRGGSDAVVRILLANGADPERTDLEGMTPLQLACQLGQLDIVRSLITLGKADPGRQPSWVAHLDHVIRVLSNYMDHTSAIISYNRSFLKVVLYGPTPLWIAMLSEHYLLDNTDSETSDTQSLHPGLNDQETLEVTDLYLFYPSILAWL